MKRDKIEQMIVKDYHKNKEFWYGKDADNVLVFAHGNAVCYILPESIFLFDFDKISEGKRYFDGIEKLFNGYIYFTAQCTNELKILNDKRTLVKYKCDDREFWFNTKFFDMFDNYSLMVGGKNSPAKVYEGKRLVGLVMPTNFRREKQNA